MTSAPGEVAAVEVRDLVKRYRAPDGRPFNAVDGVSFTVRSGEVFGLLGPNGAGKTTTLEMIEGLRQPTEGGATVLGLDVEQERERVKQRIGIQLQAGAYFDNLTLEEILDLFGSFYRRHVPPAELLERVDLLDKRKSLVKHLSGGQAQRFSIVAALVNDPEVVFLDEPTTGLDPQARRNLWDVIRDINADGKTVILTTHYMEEAELLCDRIGVIDHGRVVALDSTMGLIKHLEAPYRIHVVLDAATDEPAELGALAAVEDVRPGAPLDGATTWHVQASDAGLALRGLFAWADGRGIAVRDLEVRHASLEDVFLALTGHELRE